MGLIKAIAGAVGGVLADEWREYFYCGSLPSNVLAAKGQKRADKRSSNKKGSENVISNGSIIAVNEGQCMIIVDQGAVVDLSAEPGEFIYDTSTEPSIFYGGLGKGILGTFEKMKIRFGFGGQAAKDQRIYFFNTKEIMGNKYGTATPVPFRVVDRNIGLDVDIAIRCNGEYSFRITDPLLFYKNVCGNVEKEFAVNAIESMLKSEVLTALQPAFARLSEMGIRYSALPGHTMELADALNDVLSKKWIQTRGIAIASFGINSATASKEDEDLIKQLQKSAALRDPGLAGATLIEAQADAMKKAAENQGGAFTGFMGMNMAQGAGGANASELFGLAASKKEQQAQESRAGEWVCSCGEKNTGKFCQTCGNPKPAESGWKCPNCGAVNKGKFCAECGKPKPANELTYKCDKCGWEPSDPQNPPKFCPECGDVFDDRDVAR
ncbi:MAG: SPFH domain-containing protein [Eubacteriaceae bacterium]|jgi:membrane protease subunit (stomatin/prohibitin family)|nr:SPFH domain-containing protein [Eubacteriaceae bacterium]